MEVPSFGREFTYNPPLIAVGFVEVAYESVNHLADTSFFGVALQACPVMACRLPVFAEYGVPDEYAEMAVQFLQICDTCAVTEQSVGIERIGVEILSPLCG